MFVGWDETNAASLMSGITSDNGKTWAHIPNTSPGTGGKIAMSATNPKNLVWSPFGGPAATPQYSTDGGATWKKCTTGGQPMKGSWQLTNQYWAGEILAADQVTGGTFYYLDANTSFFVSVDNGATWTATNPAWPQPASVWSLNPTVVPNPVKAGEIWISFKPNDNQTTPCQLIRSTDSGKSFQAISSVDSANYVTFGLGNTPTTPFIYIHGRANGDTADAIYKSEDSGATWTRITDPRTQQFGEITTLAGDMRRQDLVYVGMGGRGIVYGYGPKSGLAGAQLSPSGVANLANPQAAGIAPGALIRLQPAGNAARFFTLAPPEAGVLPSMLDGYQLLFDGQPAPLFSLAPGEVVAVAPAGIAQQSEVEIQELYPASGVSGASLPVLTQPVAVNVAPASPAIFAGTNGSGPSFALNADGTPNSAHAPAATGSVVTFYMTGAGVLSLNELDGQFAGGVSAQPAGAVQVQFGGVAATAVTAHVVTGVVMAIVQVTATVPAGAPTGATVALTATVAGVATPGGATIAIQ